jgi:hypothetical protein
MASVMVADPATGVGLAEQSPEPEHDVTGPLITINESPTVGVPNIAPSLFIWHLLLYDIKSTRAVMRIEMSFCFIKVVLYG